ncbi:MAG TPA: type I restriction endonuclease, partial [Anaerolineales bacterium]|nr:type I restriction endonuclease [Anaerolineales bacterium]
MTTANERTIIELPLIDQLQRMGWGCLEGDIDVPYLTERESFREVLLIKRLRDALRRINLDEIGQPWLDETRLTQALGALERLGAHRLMEANMAATELLLKGVAVEGDTAQGDGRARTIRFIDFDHPDRNDFLVINQFRVDVPGGQTFIVPDTVLFVNGIPLVVAECKSPAATNPMEEGITQLLRYSNQRDWVDADEGAERLFHYNQFLISTCWYQARFGAIGASYEDYVEWKDTSPVPASQVMAELNVGADGNPPLTSQQILVAGMLRPEHLLDLVRNFILFQQSGGRTSKIVARYPQFRAVHEALRRLRFGQTRPQHGERDQRGGIIWHTQGSGKSLTMVFLVRKMRTLPDLRRFKVVAVTDRTDLEKQLSDTAALTGEPIAKATATEELKTLLRAPGADLVFALIQKYQGRDDAEPAEGEAETFPVLNESDSI